jgi:hypothetical protein
MCFEKRVSSKRKAWQSTHCEDGVGDVEYLQIVIAAFLVSILKNNR